MVYHLLKVSSIESSGSITLLVSYRCLFNMNRVVLIVLLSSVCWHACQSHLCLLQPRQRGIININTGGSGACFQNQPPCGRNPVQDPTDTYKSGDTIIIKFQQNYNHYEVGFPGYLDLAIADSQNMSQFTTISVINDFYPRQQDNQRNYTVITQLPAITCDHCVLRVRYNPHKPNEPIFHQCADIRITQSAPREVAEESSSEESFPDSSLPKIALLQQMRSRAGPEGSLWGFSYSPVEINTCTYVRIDPSSGLSTALQTFPFGIGGGEPGFFEKNYMIDQVFAVNTFTAGQPRNFAILQNQSDPDSTPNRWMEIVTDSGRIRASDQLTFPTNGMLPIAGLIPAGPDTYFALQIRADIRNYYFRINRLYKNGTLEMITETPTSETPYVNYMWAEYHPMLNTIIVLMGHSDTAEELECRLYFFPLDSPGTVTFKQINVTKFTFQSFHVHDKNDTVVYALSPGLNGQTYPSWYLIAIDLGTGDVRKVAQVVPGGFFQGYYGGSVLHGLDQNSGMIYHVLRVADSHNVDVIARVNLMTGNTMLSSPTSLRHIHNMAYYRQATNQPVTTTPASSAKNTAVSLVTLAATAVILNFIL